MRKTLIVLPLFLAGCGSYPLGTSYPLQAQTQDQTDLAILVCKEKAKQAIQTPGRLTASFVAGLTIIGAPIAIADARRAEREAFSECMTAKGYRVEQDGQMP